MVVTVSNEVSWDSINKMAPAGEQDTQADTKKKLYIYIHKNPLSNRGPDGPEWGREGRCQPALSSAACLLQHGRLHGSPVH